MDDQRPARRRLSQLDAFFVAYQEASGAAMQLGAEVELRGALRRHELETALAALVEVWPHLGQTLERPLLGLRWGGPVRHGEMLAAGADAPSLEAWRNVPIDPFREPPFQLLWLPDGERHLLAFRAHHAAADGQSFFAACTRVLQRLADASTVRRPAPRGPVDSGGASDAKDDPGDLFSPRRLLRQGKLVPMGRHLLWVIRESKAGRSARLAIRSDERGPIDVCRRRLAPGELATDAGKPWRCCAAWARALAGWNAERGIAPAPVSLEVPISVRRGRTNLDRPRGYALGNYVSPLILFADGDRPAAELARDLRRQMVRGVRARHHLAMPLFTAPSRYLPWAVFRRTAAGTTFSGFATSHFTWLEQDEDPAQEIARRSGGRLEMTDVVFYTPVCLHMGAALMALPSSLGLDLAITYRRAALDAGEAGALADRVVAELCDSGPPL